MANPSRGLQRRRLRRLRARRWAEYDRLWCRFVSRVALSVLNNRINVMSRTFDA